MARGAVALLVLLAIPVIGCGGSASGGAGGTGGAAGGTGGGAGGTGGAAGGTGGGAGGTGGGAGTGGPAACGVATGAPGSGATCNAVAAGGPCVQGTFSTTAAPAPAGGAFEGGTYNVVSQTFHGSADAGALFAPGQPFRQTFVLSDVTSTSFTLDQAWASGDVVARAHETAVVSGMTATFTQTCPPADAGSDWSGSPMFTATSNSITLFSPWINGIIQVTVFNKAP